MTTTHSFTLTENTISQSFIVVKNLKTNSQPTDHHSKLTTGVGRGVRGEGGLVHLEDGVIKGARLKL